jgi:hypothetical protein
MGTIRDKCTDLLNKASVQLLKLANKKKGTLTSVEDCKHVLREFARTTSLMRWSTTSKSSVLHDFDTLSRIARRLVDRHFDKQITERRGLLPFFKHGSSAVMQACLDRIGWHEDGE